MQAIEFETQLENGMIHLPVSYQHWQEGRQVKVIVLVEEERDNKSEPAHAASINRHAGTITLTQDPVDFQISLRNEWP